MDEFMSIRGKGNNFYKAMSVVIHPTKIFEYFNNVVDPIKARQLRYLYRKVNLSHRY